MNAFLLLTVLVAAPLLCGTVDLIDCSGNQISNAVKMAVQHINQQHDHGYKFRLKEIKSSVLETVDGVSCTIELQLTLGETDCPFISPKSTEDCEYRDIGSWAVTANCSVLINVNGADAQVTKYGCSMAKEPASSMEMVMICPDCPKLVQLDEEGAIRAVVAGVAHFNKNATNQHLYALQDVGRNSLGFTMMLGMMYYSQFVLVETRCPFGSKMAPEACVPLCPDRASHAFCSMAYTTRKNEVVRLNCEFFPPKNFTPLGAGVEEPTCTAPQRFTASERYVVTCPGAGPDGDRTIHPICPYPAPPALPSPPQS
ncbi:unnamed protein product [Ophioblennius macclurei]